MDSMRYNFNRTHDFLPEISSDEIKPSINACKFNALTQNKKVISISIRVKHNDNINSTKKLHHKQDNNYSKMNSKSISFLQNHNRKLCDLKNDVTNTEPISLVSLFQTNKNSIQNSLNIFHNNAICVLYIDDGQCKREYAKTEVIWNQDEPNWVKNITLEVPSNLNETLIFEIYEIVSNDRNIEHQKLLASASTSLSILIHSINKYIQIPLLIDGAYSNSWHLDINYCEFLPNVDGSYIFNFKVNKLQSPLRIIQSPQPYFIIKRLNESSNHYMNIYKSEVEMNLKNKTAEWDNLELNLQAVCGGDIDLPLRVSIYDFQSTKHVNNKNGSIDTTLRRIIENKDFDFIDTNGKITAHLHADFISKNENPCFFDIKLKGLKIQPILGIDFSSTKINYVDSNKLLHFDNSQFSYVAAITEIYDSIHELVNDQSFISYAFANFKGAKVLPLFCENMKENKKVLMKLDQTKNICCTYTPKNLLLMPSKESKSERKSIHSSIKSIIESYNYTKNHISYPENSLLEPLISKALKDAQNRFEVDRTITLLIVVSNGVFDDFNIAINRLVEAEESPLITLFVLMDGMRTEIYNSIVQRKGILIDDLGLKAKRKLADVVIYSDGSMLSDNRLDSKIIPSVEKMTIDFFRTHQISFYI